MAAIWRRGVGAPTRLQITDQPPDPSDLAQHRVVDLSGFLSEDRHGKRVQRYAIIKQDEVGPQQHLLQDLKVARFKEQAQALRDEGCVPRTYQSYVDAQGDQRICSIWEEATRDATMLDAMIMSRADANRTVGAPRPPGYVPIDAHVDPVPRGVQSSTSPRQEEMIVWERDAERDAVMLLETDMEEHLNECRRVSQLGYRPVGLSVQIHSGVTVLASAWQRPRIPESVRDQLASQQANAAVALIRLGEDKPIWPLLELRPDPRLRSYLIDRIALGATADMLWSRIAMLANRRGQASESQLFATLLCLGNLARDSAEVRATINVQPLLELYEHHPDAGVHSAVEWTLRQFHVSPPQLSPRAEAASNWFVDASGQTMSVINAPVRFLCGSPEWEIGRWVWERQEWVTIDYDYAIGTKEVTVEEYEKYVQEVPSAAVRWSDYTPKGEQPSTAVTWFHAAAYCNWLTTKQGLPESELCYLWEDDPNGEERRLVPAPDILSRGGYRLPTHIEWEYACRAGTTTQRYFGGADDLVNEYAFSEVGGGSTIPVGRLKPNDLGLFDAIGNAREWSNSVVGEGERMLLGGSFYFKVPRLRSASRGKLGPNNTLFDIGFRVARTLKGMAPGGAASRARLGQ